MCKAKDLFWNYCESVSPNLKRNDPTTWEDKYWLGNPINGIVNACEFNHSEFCWSTRLLPAVKDAFSLIWNDDKLIVSFDAGNAFRPWKRNPLWLTSSSNWWHVDQNALKGITRQGRVSVQGLVSYYDVDESTGGLCVIPGSHKFHDKLCQRSSSAKLNIDFVQISTDDSYLRDQIGILIKAKAGDMILWDSRTVHCNTHALNIDTFIPLNETEIKDHSEIIRLVSYVCMVPRSTCSNEVIESRKEAFITRTPTSHWPNIKIESFWCDESNRRLINKDISPEILALVGYDDLKARSYIGNIKSSCVIQ